MEKVYLSKPYVTGNEKEYVIDAINSNWIAPLGPYVNRFEEALNKYIGGDHYCVAMSSGTAAIHIALVRLGVKAGDYVFCSSLTFIGSCNPILYTGATPVFLDCELDNWCLCPKSLEKALIKYESIGKLPKALIAVDLFGLTPNYKEIKTLCEQYGVTLIEDAAEALGSKYKNQASGTFGEYGIFSFNGNKIITSSGGGALVCKNKEEAQKVMFLITQARDQAPYYEHSEIGFNYRLSNICAAIGLAQLEDLDSKISNKRAVHDSYVNEFASCDNIQVLSPKEDNLSNHWLTCIRISNTSFDTIKALISDLNELNFEARHAWKPMHLQPLFKGCDFIYFENDCSNSIFESSICLPSSCDIDQKTINKICNLIKEKVN